jgi:predicted acyl esterase
VADLFVSLSGTDADFIVKVIDVFARQFTPVNPVTKYPMGGYQMLVRGRGIMRGRYRDSFEKPEAFTPGKPNCEGKVYTARCSPHL